MAETTAVLEAPYAESPFWSEGQPLSELEYKSMVGTRSMTRLVHFRSQIKVDVNFENLSKDFFEEAFSPFGHAVRDYRQANSRDMGGQLEYPDYVVVPREMRAYAKEMSEGMKEVEASPFIDNVISLAAKAHRLVYIHPFADGNGRVSRAMANYVLLRFGCPIPDWRVMGRDAYLDAVAKGDDEPKAFEKFLTQALISAFQKREEIRLKSKHSVLSTQGVLIGETKQQLEDHLASLN